MVITSYKKLSFTGLAIYFGTTMPKIREIMIQNNMIFQDSSPKGERINKAIPQFIESEKIGHGIMWLWERDPTIEALQNIGLKPATKEELKCTIKNWHGFHNPISIIYEEFSKKEKSKEEKQSLFSQERYLEVQIMATGHFGNTTKAGIALLEELSKLKSTYPKNWEKISHKKIFKAAIKAITEFLTRQRCSKSIVGQINNITKVVKTPTP